LVLILLIALFLSFSWFIFFFVHRHFISFSFFLIQFWFSFFQSFFFFFIIFLIYFVSNLALNYFLSFCFYTEFDPYCLAFKLFYSWKFYFIIFPWFPSYGIILVSWFRPNLSSVFFWGCLLKIDFLSNSLFDMWLLGPLTSLFVPLFFLLNYHGLLSQVIG
jgi:hypothetical protein